MIWQVSGIEVRFSGLPAFSEQGGIFAFLWYYMLFRSSTRRLICNEIYFSGVFMPYEFQPLRREENRSLKSLKSASDVLYSFFTKLQFWLPNADFIRDRTCNEFAMSFLNLPVRLKLRCVLKVASHVDAIWADEGWDSRLSNTCRMLMKSTVRPNAVC